MQSRSSEAVVSCCTVETMSSDSDLVDIKSVTVHPRCLLANCAMSDDRADSYVYNDDDYDDESLSAGRDNCASRPELLMTAVRPDVSDIPSTNGIVDMSLSFVDKSAMQVAGKMLSPPFCSESEVLCRAVELIDSQIKPDDCGGNNNSFQHGDAECFKHAVNNACHSAEGDGTIETAEAMETYGKVLLIISIISIHYTIQEAQLLQRFCTSLCVKLSHD